jgi:hypothetical protein
MAGVEDERADKEPRKDEAKLYTAGASGRRLT